MPYKNVTDDEAHEANEVFALDNEAHEANEVVELDNEAYEANEVVESDDEAQNETDETVESRRPFLERR